MDSFCVDQEVLNRLPLAEAVLLLLGQAALPEHCLELFANHRELCYERQIAFDLFVAMIRDALLKHGGSGRQAFAQARLDGVLHASNQAAYEKLAHVPLALSQAFLAENTQRLRPLLPEGLPSPVPASLRRFRVLTADGKVTKRVAKKLKVLRGLAGGALGGKGLVCLDQHSGLVLCLAGCADGDANDCSLVPALIEGVLPLLAEGEEPLFVADSQFADLTQPRRFMQLPGGRRGHVLLRYSAKTHFKADKAARPANAAGREKGTDSRGRPFRQEWGWLGRPGSRQRLLMRRIILERPGEKAVAVLTDLLDPEEFPAEDLLECYLSRGQIEGVFQKITEVFSLDKLISSRPKGTVFQLAFCLLLYNLIEVVRSHIACGQNLASRDVSAQMLFTDVQKQLTALSEVVSAEAVAQLVPGGLSPAATQRRLAVLLHGLWKPIWRKTVNKKRRAHPDKPRDRVHCCVHRALEKAKEQKAIARVANGP